MRRSSFRPLPLDQQVMVITEASKGIGLATARLAAARGVKVAMSARNGEELQRCVDEIVALGGKALGVMADVSRPEDLLKLRDQTLKEFGQINTWINSASVSLSGQLMKSEIQEERRLFETNFWGTKIGSRLAVEEMSRLGGVLINLGSEVSAASQPFLGMYAASKQAVKAFTDALRSELKDEDLPIEVCLIRPASFDTPFVDSAAEAILKCAINPQRDVYVGGPARLSAILDTFFPEIKDIVAESRMKDLRKGEVTAKAPLTRTFSKTIKQFRKSNNQKPGREL